MHDWLTGMRGGEKVLEVFCEHYPEADLFTLLHNPGSVSPLIENRKIITSFVNRLPFKKKRYRHYLPLFPTAIEQLDFRGYDLILSTSHCVAKGVRTPPGTLHISYLHTPMRYVWDMYESYFGSDKVGKISGALIPLFANYLRMWDVNSSQRVDAFIANSNHVARRIQRYYRRQATVMYPPVDTDRFKTDDTTQQDFYLIVSALVPYKGVDLAIQAFNKSGKKLYVVGGGPEKKRLQKQAGSNIRFFDWVSDAELENYMQNCRALIFPGEEDFGIVPVEAQSAGKPVIALKKGGALETVIGYNGKNAGQCSGVFFDKARAEDLQAAVDQFESLDWDAGFIRAHAEKFSRRRFKAQLNDYIEAQLKDFFERDRQHL